MMFCRNGTEANSASVFNARILLYLAVLGVLGFTLNGCADSDSSEAEPGSYGTPFTWSIDESMEVGRSEAPRPLGGTSAVAGAKGSNGVVATFVEGEVVVSGEESAIEDTLDLLGGETLDSFDPEEQGFSELPPLHLIEVDTSRANLDTFASTMREASPKGDTMGELVFSSEEGARTLALVAAARVEGADVSPSWIGENDQALDGDVQEAPASPAGWSSNALDWPHFSIVSNQAIGVDLSWALMEREGLFSNKVGVAVLDSGFCPRDNEDFPGNLEGFDTTGASVSPAINSLCGLPKFGSGWHGTHVFGAAMGVADDGYGVTGPAAPVADPAMAVHVLYDPYTTANALVWARSNGADIATMSYRWQVPYGLGWTVRGFYTGTTDALEADGMLLFGSAGNADTSVDNEGCVGVNTAAGCVGDQDELMFHVPCELPSVTCVGGLKVNSKDAHPDTNWGADDVDMSGPYVVPKGPDPDDTQNNTETIVGTSFATPFVAGVSALVWATDPSQSNDDVRQALFNNVQSVNYNGNTMRRGHVCASCIIEPMLPDVAPTVSIASPLSGSTIRENQQIAFSANVSDLEDDFRELDFGYQWSSASSGNLSTQATFTDYMCPGSREVSVEVTDSEGGSSSDSVTFSVISASLAVEAKAAAGNSRYVRVEEDASGDLVIDPLTVVATARRPSCSDPVGDEIPQTGFSWTDLSDGTFFASGNSVTVDTFDLTNSDGEIESLTLQAEYSLDGEMDSDTVTIEPCTYDSPNSTEPVPAGFQECPASAVAGEIQSELERTFGTSDPDEIALIISGQLDDLIDRSFAEGLEDNGFCDPRVCDPGTPLGQEAIESEIIEKFGEQGGYLITGLFETVGGIRDGFDFALEEDRRQAAENSGFYDDEAMAVFRNAVAVVEGAADYFEPSYGEEADNWEVFASVDDPQSLGENVNSLSPAEGALRGYLTSYLKNGDPNDSGHTVSAAYGASKAAAEEVRNVMMDGEEP